MRTLGARQILMKSNPAAAWLTGSMGKPKRHHYLPKFFLAGFTTDGGRDSIFTVFDRDEGEFRPQTPKNIAVRGYYYAVEDEATGKKSTHVEEFLSEIEGEAEPVIRKLEAGQTLTGADKEHLALFCALLHTRVPQFDRAVQEMIDGGIKEVNRRLYNTLDDITSHCEEWQEKTGQQSEMSPEEAFTMIQEGDYTVAEPRQNIIKLMLDLSSQLAELFLNMDWAIGHAPPKMSLLVTDAPLLLIPPTTWRPGDRPFGLATPGAHKMVPLSRRIAVFIGDVGSGFVHLQLTKGQVRENNLALAARCERFIIGSDEPLVRYVVRQTDVATTPRRPMIVVE
jgi:hypothetical protein